MEKQDKDVTTYQLGARVMDLLGMHNGVMTKLQQYCTQADNYFSCMAALQYDMLYGNHYAYGGGQYEKTFMEMGIDPVTIADLGCVGNTLYVTGDNFTPASKIYINGEQASTTFLNSGRISCNSGDDLTEGDLIEVIQMSSRRTKLSSAGVMEWHIDGSVPVQEPIRNVSLNYIESKDAIQDDIDKEENDI